MKISVWPWMCLILTQGSCVMHVSWDNGWRSFWSSSSLSILSEGYITPSGAYWFLQDGWKKPTLFIYKAQIFTVHTQKYSISMVLKFNWGGYAIRKKILKRILMGMIMKERLRNAALALPFLLWMLNAGSYYRIHLQVNEQCKEAGALGARG